VDNIVTYQNIFREVFSLKEPVTFESLEYQTTEDWDSVGHMELITQLENAFKISMDMDDVIDFGSYLVGIQILEKYGIDIA
jgi:acyl carrier protein